MEEEIRKEKNTRQNWKLFAGIFIGIAVTIAAIFLYRGYYTVKLPVVGVLTVKLPTYGLFHKNTGAIDSEELSRKIEEIDYYLDNEYLYDSDPKSLGDGAVRGIMDTIAKTDIYASYFSAEEYKTQSESWKGNYTGIGVLVRLDQETKGVFIESVTKGGPAEAAGLRAGDVIIQTDDTDIRGMELTEITEHHIKGEEGTVVLITVLRDGQEMQFSVERKVLDTRTVYTSTVSLEGKTYGYLYVSQFLTSTLNAFTEAVDSLTARGVDGLLIDLRDDPGGDMNICLAMADYLLPDQFGDYSEDDIYGTMKGKTLLLSISQKKGDGAVYFSCDGHDTDLPIVLLVNENSASAAEILTGVLSSYGSSVCGMKTYGKGIVQTVRMLYDMSGIKYTSGEYVLPDGRRIHQKGIEPDVTVEPSEELKKNGADPENPDIKTDNQLKAALKLLGEQL